MRSAQARSRRRRQMTTVMLLFGGYAACYFCRADLSVATPLLIQELGTHGVSHSEALVRIGTMSSFGVLAYALGKLFLGWLGDFWGGRPNFLIALAGATACTLLFATGATLPLFTIAWIGNRLTQSLGWAGLIKVSSKWFDYSVYGTILGILSTSYLIGDAAARQFMGMLIQHGCGWRALFYFAAAVVGALLIANLLFLRESRVEAGHGEATAVALVVLMSVHATSSGSAFPVVTIGVIAFCLLGPYSYLGGAFALDLGGKQAGAVSSGIIDSVGYLGGVLAGDSVARISVAFGWQGVFVVLASVSALSALGAGYLLALGAAARAAGRHVS